MGLFDRDRPRQLGFDISVVVDESSWRKPDGKPVRRQRRESMTKEQRARNNAGRRRAKVRPEDAYVPE